MNIKSEIVLIGGSSSQFMTEKLIKRRGAVKPKYIVLPTASGDDPEIIKEITGYLENTDAGYIFLELTRKEYEESYLRKTILGADIIYVPGGNNDVLLDCWKKTKVDTMIREAAEQGGALLAGSSAGAMVFSAYCPFIDPESGERVRYGGYGLVPVVFCPHYQLERYYTVFDKSVYDIDEGDVCFATGDDCGILCTPDGRYFTFFGSEGNSAWRFEKKGDSVTKKEYRPGDDIEI